MSSTSFAEGLLELSQDPTARAMVAILATLVVGTASFGMITCTPTPNRNDHWWLPNPNKYTYKRNWEVFSLVYGIIWMSCFASIVAFKWYASFTEWHYLLVLLALALPLILQPLLFPRITGEEHVPLLERYSFKVNVWLAVFSFIANYFYTHYFYTVLNASYTMRAHDINGVPICMIFATHFYFSFYHTLANLFLRKIATTYKPGFARTAYFSLTVLTLSYIVAFMESLTISYFPCYSFEDRHYAYTIGSAFYGIYFIVSFPMFLRLDRDKTYTVFETIAESLATSMAILCLLDFVRVGLGQDLVLKLDRPCKNDASLTCVPFEEETC